MIPFCKARLEMAKIKPTNTIERPGRSTDFWKQKIRPDMDGESRIRHKPSAQRL